MQGPGVCCDSRDGTAAGSRKSDDGIIIQNTNPRNPRGAKGGLRCLALARWLGCGRNADNVVCSEPQSLSKKSSFN